MLVGADVVAHGIEVDDNERTIADPGTRPVMREEARLSIVGDSGVRTSVVGFIQLKGDEQIANREINGEFSE